MPDLGGKPCFGADRQKEICSVPYCPIDGKWSEWSLWSECSASCGSGTKIRYRKCNNPPAIHGGAYCIGDNVESFSCYVASCAGKKIGSINHFSFNLIAENSLHRSSRWLVLLVTMVSMQQNLWAWTKIPKT